MQSRRRFVTEFSTKAGVSYLPLLERLRIDVEDVEVVLKIFSTVGHVCVGYHRYIILHPLDKFLFQEKK